MLTSVLPWEAYTTLRITIFSLLYIVKKFFVI